MIDEMIFDLQRFDGDEIYIATAADETVRIAKSSGSLTATSQKAGYNAKKLKPVTKGNTISGVNAAAGDDYINVAAEVENISILGGRGADTLDLATRTASGGITYVYNYGDGLDVIRGWDSDKDVLVIDGDWYSPVMSDDGNKFLINYGSGQIAFEGLEYGKTIKVQTPDGVIPYTVERIFNLRRQC